MYGVRQVGLWVQVGVTQTVINRHGGGSVAVDKPRLKQRDALSGEKTQEETHGPPSP